MSTKNKNTVKQAVLEAIEMKNTIKEESKDLLKEMLGEAVKDAIRESVEDDEKEDSYDVIDDNEPENDGQVEEPESTEEPSEDVPEVADSEEEPTADKWDEFDDYQTGENDTYDLTGVKDYDKIVKVFELMDDDDHLVVKQDGDKITLKDNETSKEYIIDLGMNSNESIEGESEEEGTTNECIVKEDTNIAGIPSTEDGNEEIEFEFTPEDLNDVVDTDESILTDDEEEPRFNESKKGNKVMKERKEKVYEVSLGYTDDYQDKDPIQGLSNDEPSKSGKSWEKGVPTGTEKPWAGPSKDKGQPFEETVNEENVEECGNACMTKEPVVDEATNVGGAVQQRTTPKSHIPNDRKEYGPKVKRHVSTAADGYEEMVENLKKENAQLKKINEAYKKENAILKQGTKELKANIKEAYVVNTNLAKITRLFTENVVSQDERREIVNRFANEAKTIEQSKALYESINKELKKNEKQLTLENGVPSNVNGSKTLNENKYQSQDLLSTLDLIKRMENR